MPKTPTSVAKKPQFEFLSHEDIEKLYKHYTLLDPKAATSHGVSVSHLLDLPNATDSPLAKRIMECFDENGDGSVDFEEFVNGLAVFSSRGRRIDKIKFAFDIYDIDRDGFISNGELFLVLKTMCGDTMDDVNLQNIVDKTIRDVDEDGDGRISFDEFKKMVLTRNSSVFDKWNLSDL